MMTASEKLKALEAALHFDTPTDRATFVAGRDAENNIIRALPQIVAVTSAAERAAEYASEPDARKAASVLRQELVPALTALEEALA